MAVKVGGLWTNGVSTRAANDTLRELSEVNGRVDFTDEVVDLCFMTYVPGGLGAGWAEGTGIRPGMVGRTQRRFIVNLEVPPTLSDKNACAAWIVCALEEAAQITWDYSPRKGKTYPAARLADEVDDLRARWLAHLSANA